MTPHDRCGRRAAELLDDGDVALAMPHDGAALAALLGAARGRAVRLLLPAPPTPAAALLLGRAAALGLAAAAHDHEALAAALAAGEVTLLLVEAPAAASDGAVALPLAARPILDSAAGRAPIYALAPDGPDPAAATAADLAGGALPPERVSAVVTSRGIYRPAMLHRHLTDGDAPLDVIPLT